MLGWEKLERGQIIEVWLMIINNMGKKFSSREIEKKKSDEFWWSKVRYVIKKIKSVAYSSQESHTGQLDYCK